MAAKKIKNSKRLKKLAPEELEDIWDKDTAEVWGTLRTTQQKFFVEYIANGGNAKQAYLKEINHLATDDVAKSAGPRMLASVGLSKLLRKMSDNRAYELVAIKKVYLDGMEAYKPHYGKDDDGQPEKIEDVPDHMTRKSCADSLAKINGELIERSEKNVKVHNTLIINEAQRTDINSFLVKTGQPPLVKPVEVKPVIIEDVVEEEEKVEEVFFGSFGDTKTEMLD